MFGAMLNVICLMCDRHCAERFWSIFSLLQRFNVVYDIRRTFYKHQNVVRALCVFLFLFLSFVTAREALREDLNGIHHTYV
jgi:hypothetical protein